MYMYRDNNIDFHNYKVFFRLNVPSLAQSVLKCALLAQRALPGTLPFSFSSWNTGYVPQQVVWRQSQCCDGKLTLREKVSLYIVVIMKNV